MAQFSSDVVPHDGGWILVTLGPVEAFSTKQVAYDVAAEFARKLRFAGFAVNVQAEHEPAKKAANVG